MAIHSHTHVQPTPSAEWVIDHGLQCNPAVGVKVMEGGVLTGILPANIAFPTISQVVITFSTPRTGEARLS